MPPFDPPCTLARAGAPCTPPNDGVWAAPGEYILFDRVAFGFGFGFAATDVGCFFFFVSLFASLTRTLGRAGAVGAREAGAGAEVGLNPAPAVRPIASGT